MRVLIRNKLVSLGGSSQVLSENKEPLYEVKGKVFSITKKKFIYDMQGNLLYVVRNKWFNFFTHNAYIFDAQGNKIARVKNKYFSIGAKYLVLDYPDEILFDGKFFSRSCKILKNGEEMGVLTRDFTLFADHFTLDGEEKDIPFLIALVIAIDNIQDKRSKDRD